MLDTPGLELVWLHLTTSQWGSCLNILLILIIIFINLVYLTYVLLLLTKAVLKMSEYTFSHTLYITLTILLFSVINENLIHLYMISVCIQLYFYNWYIAQPVCIMNFSKLVYLKEGLYIIMSDEVMEYSKDKR